MEIRDILHGSITIASHELPIIDSRYFQRLRQIKQLGFAENSYPTATHNRYVHSLGAMETATRVIDTILGGHLTKAAQLKPHERINLAAQSPTAFQRFRSVVRLASLLHDVGHGPLSHTTEFAMPQVSQLKLPEFVKSGKSNRKATHEDYTLKILLDSDLTRKLDQAGRKFGFSSRHIAQLIDPSIESHDDFFEENLDGARINFRPLLEQLISSELDADRMDYLRRDSWYAGVHYGQFDADWIIANLTCHLKDKNAHLAIQHRALYAFEDFLLSRFHMFLMVYFHHKSVVFDEMLGQYFETADGEYSLPSDIEKYLESHDAELYGCLAKSANPWAKRITEKRPYRMLMELHSGIPATKTAILESQRLLSKVQRDLRNQDIHSLEVTSTSELSKYYKKPGTPIFVRYDNHYSEPSFIKIEQCTDVFQRYSETRSITRIYVSPEDYKRIKEKGRDQPLPYEDGATV